MIVLARCRIVGLHIGLYSLRRLYALVLSTTPQWSEYAFPSSERSQASFLLSFVPGNRDFVKTNLYTKLAD